MRKQSLHILKMALSIQERAHSTSSVSKRSSSGKRSIPRGVTKRELWAYNEAKSLGVGKFLTSDDPIFNSEQYWDAFVLLYEMLEEYGTHLVEAAWNHQVCIPAFAFSFSFFCKEKKIIL